MKVHIMKTNCFFSINSLHAICLMPCTICYSFNAYSADFSLGVAAHLLSNNYELSDAMIANEKIHDAGLTIARMDAGWNDVEIRKGIYNIPENWDLIINDQLSKNISPMLILAYGNQNYNNQKPISPEIVNAYAAYVAYTVKHFKGRVMYYQIWNEWTSKTGQTKPGNVEDYKKLVKKIYPLIKSIDPTITIITGEFSNGAFGKILGLSKTDFYKDYLTPDMSPYTDVIGVHPYVLYRKPPNNDYSGYYKQVKYVRDLMKSSPQFEDKKIYVTEIGWSTSKTEFGVDQEQQSNLLHKAVCDAKKIGVSAVIIYQLKDLNITKGNITEAGFGIYDVNWNNKKSANIKQLKCN